MSQNSTSTNGHHDPQTIDYEIVLRDPESVLRKQLGPDLEVKAFESDSFLKVGDNYGSTILRVRVVVRRRRGDDATEELNLVAKMLPPTDFMRRIFESNFTFKKEIFIYEDLLPTYASLYDGDFDVTPRFYGARLAGEGSKDEIDDDAVILMENLKMRGYYMEDRHKGLDLAHLKIAVSALAKFHAIGLAVKHKKPSYLPTLQTYAKPISVKNEVMVPFLENMLAVMAKEPRIGPHIDRVRASGNTKDLNANYYTDLKPDYPWACVTHADLWTNNMLFHRNAESGLVDDVKIVDFQTAHISSPLTDLVFLLCTSITPSFLHFDAMLELYREEALRVTRELSGDDSLFSRKSYEERLKLDAPKELFHTLFMSKVVTLPEGLDLQTSPVNQPCLDRIAKIVEIFVDKQWI